MSDDPAAVYGDPELMLEDGVAGVFTILLMLCGVKYVEPGVCWSDGGYCATANAGPGCGRPWLTLLDEGLAVRALVFRRLAAC